MISADSKRTVQVAQELYNTRLREKLKQQHPGKYLCIEPESGDYFVGETFDDAVNAALDAWPERLTHTLRISHRAALHLGMIA